MSSLYQNGANALGQNGYHGGNGAGGGADRVAVEKLEAEVKRLTAALAACERREAEARSSMEKWRAAFVVAATAAAGYVGYRLLSNKPPFGPSLLSEKTTKAAAKVETTEATA